MTTQPKAYEVNFDGLVGPTHNYAGLAIGNLASQANKGKISNPKQAALQGLKKAKLLADLGIKQAILPPNPRPNLQLLRAIGFSGTDANVINNAYKQAPELLAACYSASSMWAANIATVSPSAHTADARVHFTVANLMSNVHRAQEAEANFKILQAIFSNDNFFCVHQPLLGCRQLGDEGDANHSVICRQYGEPGVELFVYGAKGIRTTVLGSKTLDGKNLESDRVALKLPARQILEASQAVARLHQLAENRVVFAQQNPQAISQGVFHNDVAFVANQQVLLYHQSAFAASNLIIAELQKNSNHELNVIEIAEQDLSLQDAVATYLFNSQLITLPEDPAKHASGSMVLIAPEECKNYLRAKAVLDKIVVSQTNPIVRVEFVDCRQSMQNGGGPACLRLRVILTAEQIQALTGNVMLTDALYGRLITWVGAHYRDKIIPEDLADPLLYQESRAALAELELILDLPGIYS